jgi:hypothetical protein
VRKILELAALRSKRVELAGEIFVCMEPPFASSEDFVASLKTDRIKAYAMLLVRYVKTEAGEPAFTEEEAIAIASGSSVAFMPLFLAITGFKDDEKKASPPTNSSDTASPSPSEDPSKN